MPEVTVTCDRCKALITGLELKSGTSGFYTGEYWKRYMNADEQIVCDECMWDDPRYKRDYL